MSRFRASDCQREVERFLSLSFFFSCVQPVIHLKNGSRDAERKCGYENLGKDGIKVVKW